MKVLLFNSERISAEEILRSNESGNLEVEIANTMEQALEILKRGQTELIIVSHEHIDRREEVMLDYIASKYPQTRMIMRLGKKGTSEHLYLRQGSYITTIEDLHELSG